MTVFRDVLYTFFLVLICIPGVPQATPQPLASYDYSSLDLTHPSKRGQRVPIKQEIIYPINSKYSAIYISIEQFTSAAKVNPFPESPYLIVDLEHDQYLATTRAATPHTYVIDI